jgi:hypothetical protein
MDVHIAGVNVPSPEGMRVAPPFVVPDAASLEDGVWTAARIIATAAPQGTQINVNGSGDKTLAATYVVNGDGIRLINQQIVRSPY